MFDEFKEELFSCDKCELCKYRSSVVLGEGSLDADIMVVGDFPGQNEERQFRPYCGYVGLVINDLLLCSGVSRDQAYVTYVVKCRPPEERQPTVEEVSICSENLSFEVACINPKAIVTIGNIGLESVLGGYSTIDKWGNYVKNELGFYLVETKTIDRLMNKSEFFVAQTVFFKLKELLNVEDNRLSDFIDPLVVEYSVPFKFSFFTDSLAVYRLDFILAQTVRKVRELGLSKKGEEVQYLRDYLFKACKSKYSLLVDRLDNDLEIIFAFRNSNNVKIAKILDVRGLNTDEGYQKLEQKFV